MHLRGLLPLLPRPTLPTAHDAGAVRRVVLGVPDSAKAAVTAAIAATLDGLVIVLTGKADRAEALADELAAWLGERTPVHLYPELDDAPYERPAAAPEAVERRLRVLAALRRGGPGVVVVPALAAAQRTIAPEEAGQDTLTLAPGARWPMRTLMAAVERLGYSVEPLVEAPGQAARRGGLVDVFPPTADRPVRIELLGDRVDALRAFDPATQRTVTVVDHIAIGPASESVGGPDAAMALRRSLSFERMQQAPRLALEDLLDRLAAGERVEPGFFGPFLPGSSVFAHAPAGAVAVVDEPGDLGRLLDELDEQVTAARTAMEEAGLIPVGLPLPHADRAAVFAAIAGWPTFELQRWATEETPGAVVPPFGAAPAHGGRLRVAMSDIAARLRAGVGVVVVSQQSARLAELFESEGLVTGIARSIGEPPPPGSLTLLHGSIPHGWVLDRRDGALALITDAEIFGFTKQRRAVRRSGLGREAFLLELTPGDYVVHVEHGIARFAGLTRRSVEGVEREYLELHYAEGDRLFVPTDHLDRVARYVGPGEHRPSLTRLGSPEWVRAKERVRRAVSDLAQELLMVGAAREVLPGHAFAPDTVWQQEMEAAFPYVETADQVTALREIKVDMERPRPMDRIVIGDVGYGKTELAIRAAFKAVMDGKQVAVLVPTTVLAQQHFQTFRERVAGFPVRIDVLSRFRPEREQRAITAAAAAGTIDILIGTHRILQRDVAFRDLGLVIVDEEQRFGVAHKERLKELRREVDVLTLSATPIPRTLNMSLAGIRDMSTLDTAPEERLPIRTYVSEFDERLIREAVLRELDRGGQIYVVHNRVYNIELIAAKLRQIVPEAEIAVGHGQMPEEQLERVMVDFQRGAFDVLACTTIIESGLDIPNVNTIIINQADRLGLSQLYQLRGRVGRGAHRAYAYLLYDRHHALSEVAQRRLQAIFEAGELGAGFHIALKDLEIRGAGNLLGAEQSGHIAAIGYDLYSEMLAEAVGRMRALMHGEAPPPPPPVPTTIDLPLTAHIPESYITDLNLRLAVYQRLAQMPSLDMLDAYAAELADRFGPPPPVAANLLYTVRVRLLARAVGLQSVTSEEREIVLRAARPIPHRERLAGALGPAVRPGSAQVRIEQRADWRTLLLQALERLQPDWAAAAAVARRDDFGTFAVDPAPRRTLNGGSRPRPPERPASGHAGEGRPRRERDRRGNASPPEERPTEHRLTEGRRPGRRWGR